MWSSQYRCPKVLREHTLVAMLAVAVQFSCSCKRGQCFSRSSLGVKVLQHRSLVAGADGEVSASYLNILKLTALTMIIVYARLLNLVV